MAICRFETWSDGMVRLQVCIPPCYDIESQREFYGEAPIVQNDKIVGKKTFPIPVHSFLTDQDKEIAKVCPDHLVKIAFEHWMDAKNAAEKALFTPKIALPGGPGRILPLNGKFRR